MKDVAEITGFPEMMDGRVKTLHPAVHGALLGVRAAPEHAAAMERHGIAGIDLLYVNLYPFEATVAAGGDFETCVENIDIGGPAMIRSAAKNHPYVAVCTTPQDAAEVLAALQADGATTLALRRRLAARAFARTAAYDGAISAWFAAQAGEEWPARKAIFGELKSAMRYGENPHQARRPLHLPQSPARRRHRAAGPGQGSWATTTSTTPTRPWSWSRSSIPRPAPAVVIVKHANPCGVALGETLESAYLRALECDPVSAFGGIVAVNQRLDAAAARRMVEIFTEVVIAPEADDEAIDVFAARRNLRLLLTGGLPDPAAPGETFKSVAGGFLVQARDTARLTAADLKIVTRRTPTQAEVVDMLFAFTVAKHVKSNAIVFARDGQTAGIGAGQMNRRDSVRIAALRAAEAAEAAGLPRSLADGSACASDAFFPFADGLIQAVEAGAACVIQPGGSIRDREVIEAADAAGIAMAFTGTRVFRH